MAAQLFVLRCPISLAAIRSDMHQLRECRLLSVDVDSHYDHNGHDAVNGTNSTNVRSRHGDQIATNRRSSDRPFQAISTC